MTINYYYYYYYYYYYIIDASRVPTCTYICVTTLHAAQFLKVASDNAAIPPECCHECSSYQGTKCTVILLASACYAKK